MFSNHHLIDLILKDYLFLLACITSINYIYLDFRGSQSLLAYQEAVENIPIPLKGIGHTVGLMKISTIQNNGEVDSFLKDMTVKNRTS